MFFSFFCKPIVHKNKSTSFAFPPSSLTFPFCLKPSLTFFQSSKNIEFRTLHKNVIEDYQTSVSKESESRKVFLNQLSIYITTPLPLNHNGRSPIW